MINLHQGATDAQELMPIPLIIIIVLFILNWIIRILIRKNPTNKSLVKLSFFISLTMIGYAIYYFLT